MAKGDKSSYGRLYVGTYWWKSNVQKNWIKEQPFPGAKTKNMFHSLPFAIARKQILDYVILHVGTNDAIDYEASDIVRKTLQVKELIKLRVPNCKVIISRLIKRYDNDNASRVIEEVIAQFQKLTTDMTGKENFENKQGRYSYILMALVWKNLLRI